MRNEINTNQFEERREFAVISSTEEEPEKVDVQAISRYFYHSHSHSHSPTLHFPPLYPLFLSLSLSLPLSPSLSSLSLRSPSPLPLPYLLSSLSSLLFYLYLLFLSGQETNASNDTEIDKENFLLFSIFELGM
jgi:hypothetical protein